MVFGPFWTLLGKRFKKPPKVIAQPQQPEAQPQSHKKPFNLGRMGGKPPCVKLEWLFVALRLGLWLLRLGKLLFEAFKIAFGVVIEAVWSILSLCLTDVWPI